MRINSINTLNKFQLDKNHINKNNIPSFGLYCTEYEKGIAKKYMYVKNPENAIREEIADGPKHAVLSDILKYIKILLKQEDDKILKLSGIDSKIKNENNKVNSLNETRYSLVDEIEKEKSIVESRRSKLAKILIREKQRTYLISKLKEKYLNLHKLDEKIYPGGIMIKNANNVTLRRSIISYLKKYDPNFMYINFDDIKLKNLINVINKCKDKAKNTNGHSILCIDNFRKYAIPSEENFKIINNLKGFISDCANGHKLTVLIFESHPEELEKAIVKGHRFEIIDANENLKKETTKLKNKFLKRS